MPEGADTITQTGQTPNNNKGLVVNITQNMYLECGWSKLHQAH